MIVRKIKAIADSIVSVKSFGHGRRNFANLEQENASATEYGTGNEFPRVWLYPVEVIEEIQKTGSLIPKYKLILDVCDLCNLDSSTTDIDAVLDRTEPIARELILRIFNINDSEMRLIEKISARRYELIHAMDANLVGWAVYVDIKVQELIEYPCP